jgi:hypothetical protein
VTRTILSTVCCVLLIGAVAGYSQEVHRLTVDIPHPFSISGSQMPAGRYNVELEGQSHRTVALRSADGKESAQGMIVTVISAPQGAADQPRLVFDNVGGQHFLAEIWMPGHDGFLMSGFKNDSEHKHSAIKAAPAQK